MLDARGRCAWAGADRPLPDLLMVAYHDDEWGLPVDDDRELFERLALESFQAGLSWSTILRKRDTFRAAFHGFEPAVVAGFDDSDRARLMADAGIVRNRAKIDATIGNADRFLATSAEFDGLPATWRPSSRRPSDGSRPRPGRATSRPPRRPRTPCRSTCAAAGSASWALRSCMP